jgi:hypothetical protein
MYQNVDSFAKFGSGSFEETLGTVCRVFMG